MEGAYVYRKPSQQPVPLWPTPIVKRVKSLFWTRNHAPSAGALGFQIG